MIELLLKVLAFLFMVAHINYGSLPLMIVAGVALVLLAEQVGKAIDKAISARRKELSQE